MPSLITLGLAEIQVGAAAETGVMPAVLTKIGKTYKDSCTLNQDPSDVTEHFEEGKSAPEVRRKSKKMPVLKFSIMDPDATLLAEYVGGEKDATSGAWGFNGDEIVANKAIKVVTEQGLSFNIPNGDIEAVINGEFSAKGITLVEFTVTPMAVADGKKAIQAIPPTV